MSELVLSQNSISIQFSQDGYVNATKMCKDSGKEWKGYYRLNKTQDFLKVLSRSVKISTDLLIRTVSSGKNENRGTFIHPRVAINLAQWISPEFDVAVSELVDRYVNGEVTTEESQTVAETIAKTKRKGKKPVYDDSCDIYVRVYNCAL